MTTPYVTDPYQPYENLKHKKERKDKYKTVIPKQVELSNYKIYQFILDASDRNKTTYPNLNSFVLKSMDPFRSVFAIRLLKSELNYVSGVLGRGLYVSLNNYKLLYRNEGQDTTNMFARITPGVENHQCVTTNILDDPYTYILNPLEPKLQRFEVRLFDHHNVLFDDTQFNLVLHLAIFCYV